MVYKKIPILDVARRCGIVLDERTLNHAEVKAKCPFCGDRARSYHLFLNTVKDLYHCQLCKRGGNSLTLYAGLNHLSNNAALEDLTGGSNVYRLPEEPIPNGPAEQEPLPLSTRDMVYRLMLEHLTLSEKHRKALQERGLSDEQIERNAYRSTPTNDRERKLLAAMLADHFDLLGIPGFFSDEDGAWSVYWAKGILIPVRTQAGLIQGLQIRLDNTDNGKYRWFASRYLENGTRGHSWIHVTGDIERRTAFLTEGPLKGDCASFLDAGALFICVAGINALEGLEDVLKGLSLDELVICLDMDKVVNPNVEAALWNIQAIAAKVGLHTQIKNWNPGLKGIDDLYLAQRDTGFVTRFHPHDAIAQAIEDRWAQKYPHRDRDFVSLCRWREREVPVSELKCSEPTKDDEVQIGAYLTLLKGGADQFPPLVCVNKKVADDKDLFHAFQEDGRKVVRIYENLPWQEELAA